MKAQKANHTDNYREPPQKRDGPQRTSFGASARVLLLSVSALCSTLPHNTLATSGIVSAPTGCCVYWHGSYGGSGFFLEGVGGESCYSDGQGPSDGLLGTPDAVVVNNCPYNQNAWATWPGYTAETNWAVSPGDRLVAVLCDDCTFTCVKPPKKADDKSDGPDCDPAKCCGSPVWSVSEPQMSVWLHDEPLGYNPSAGAPRISFELAFKQRETTAGMDPNIFSAGKQWNFSWFSFVALDSKGSNVVHFPNGKERTFTATNDFLTNTRITGNTSSGFTVSYPDGSKDVYGFIVSSGGGAFLKAFMTERWNPHSQKTTLYYTNYSGPVTRLLYIVDNDNRTNTVSYVASNTYSTNLISQVVDAFNRTNVLSYHTNGCLTNILDVSGLSASMTYDSSNRVRVLTTPFATNTFDFDDVFAFTSCAHGRAVLVTQPDGGHHLYFCRDAAVGVASSYGGASVPDTSPYSNTFETSDLNSQNTFYWGPRQYANLSTTNFWAFTSNDFQKGRMQHWLKSTTTNLLGCTLGMSREPSPDAAGVVAGGLLWFDHAGKPSSGYEGSQSAPLCFARVLSDGSTTATRNERNSWGSPVASVVTYSIGTGTLQRTNAFTFAADDIDVVSLTNALGIQTVTNIFNAYHQVATNYNALGETTVFTYNASHALTSVTRPSGLVTTNLYGTDGLLSMTYDYAIIGGTPVYYRTNSYTYVNNLVYTHIDERGRTEVNTWDNLQRLTSQAYSDGSYISNRYTYLDRTAFRDRNGFWTTLGFDFAHRVRAITNASGYYRTFNYCTCGSLDSIQDEAGQLTQFFYDNQARLTNTVLADSFAITNFFDSHSRLTNSVDSAGTRVTNWFNNQGLLVAVSNALGRVQTTIFDALDRATNSTDGNGVTLTNTFDSLNRLLTRTFPDLGSESFGYTSGVAGFTSQTNQLGSNVLNVVYDPLGRKTTEIFPGVSTNSFTYTPAGDLRTLTDGRGFVVTWGTDENGRTTNKLDQASTEILRYKFDANGRLTNRWSAAMGNTVYAWDPVGNLTNINYPASPDVSLAYDVLNRLTNMVDGVGTTKFAYTSAGQLLTEDGPWASDTVTNTYANRLRTMLSLQQPTSFWTNGFGYDSAKRLTNVTISAGSFSYGYGSPANQYLVSSLILPNTSYITNTFDSVGRTVTTALKTSGGTVRDSYSYVYNPANQRTNLTRLDSSTVAFKYDNAGEVTLADSSVAAEDRGYFYDAGWNLNRRTNNGVTGTFSVNTLNELTNAPGGVSTFDANGNTLTSETGNRQYQFDDENRLVSLLVTNNGGNSTFTDFYYDGLSRLRKRLEYQYVGSIGGGGGDGAAPQPVLPDSPPPDPHWELISETHYIYDGNRVIQERDTNNTPLVVYARGIDLSGTMEGAGGIGGLLARSSTYSSGNWSSYAYYFADGNGNITAMLDASQNSVASYRYDPFGNLISSSGTLAGANVYRFSSKEFHAPSALYYHLFRFYDPGLQKWVNQDPLRERGGLNLYGFVANDPVNFVDPYGLAITGQPYPRIAGGGGSVTINGTTYIVTTKSEFIVALRTSTSGGDKIETFTYDGHGSPDDGGLSWAANKDQVTANGYISPQDLQTYLDHYKDLFDPHVRVKLKSCGSANPNVFSSADAFKKVFPESTVSGYTGLYLPYIGGVWNIPYFTHGESFPNTPHSSSWITK
jgi:RHS repeat-associated protein